MYRKCYPLFKASQYQQRVPLSPKQPDWHILSRFSANFYILSRNFDSHVRYVPLYILSFALCHPHNVSQAVQQYRSYEEIQNVPDRLRWCRYHRGWTQSEVAQQVGITKSVYCSIESGLTQHIPTELADKLARPYTVPVTDLLDDFNCFLYEGQAKRIQAYRQQLGLGRKSFARCTGIPLTSLREWENGKKVISRRCWEQYFKGKA